MNKKRFIDFFLNLFIILYIILIFSLFAFFILFISSLPLSVGLFVCVCLCLSVYLSVCLSHCIFVVITLWETDQKRENCFSIYVTSILSNLILSMSENNWSFSNFGHFLSKHSWQKKCINANTVEPHNNGSQGASCFFPVVPNSGVANLTIPDRN